MRRRKQHIASSACLLLVAWMSGCGTTADILVPGLNYTSRAGDYREAVVSGAAPRLHAKANEALGRTRNQDGVLYALEAARLQSLAGDFEASVRTYQLATDIFDTERAAPTVSFSRTFFSATALATNDLAIPYRSESHERLMAYNYLALNFLLLGQFDNAQIALTAAEAEQQFLREREADLVAEAERESRQRGIGWSAQQEALRGAQQQILIDRTVLEPWQSALTYYLAGLMFEARGEPDRAGIALRQGASLLPDNPYIDRALAGLPNCEEDRSARVVVISSDGLISSRSTIAVPFFWNRTILQVALPVYDQAPPPIRPITVRSERGLLGNTAVIANTDGQARKTLSQRYPAMFTRQVLRLVAKYQTQNQLAQENPWAGLAAQLFNLLTDKADLRGWLTLPAHIQAAHFDLEPGKQRLELDGAGIFDLTLPPRSLSFVVLTRTGGSVYRDVVTFDADGNPVESFRAQSNAEPSN